MERQFEIGRMLTFREEHSLCLLQLLSPFNTVPLFRFRYEIRVQSTLIQLMQGWSDGIGQLKKDTIQVLRVREERMDEERRRPLNATEIKELAEELTSKMCCCALTEEEIVGVRSLLGVRKSSLKLLIWVAGIMVALAVKDLWSTIMAHLRWIKQ